MYEIGGKQLSEAYVEYMFNNFEGSWGSERKSFMIDSNVRQGNMIYPRVFSERIEITWPVACR